MIRQQRDKLSQRRVFAGDNIAFIIDEGSVVCLQGIDEGRTLDTGRSELGKPLTAAMRGAHEPLSQTE